MLENEYIDTVTVDNVDYTKGKLSVQITVSTIYNEEISETYETEVA